ncbi:MAG: sulfite exporter TauE/SafE family protein [Chloroflexota bacterium]
MNRRRVLPTALLAGALLAIASPAAAHPLGNATANRAVAVTVLPEELHMTYVLDLAEIPAYAALLDMDVDTDGRQSETERARWASGACDAAATALQVAVDDLLVPLAARDSPKLTFPPGVGGLETLRLECRLAAPLMPTAEVQTLSVTDTADDGRRGWREITIMAGAGVVLATSDAPAVSPSELLSAYPDDLLQSPVDVRVVHATFRPDTSGLNAATSGGAGTATAPTGTAPADPLADLLGGTDTPMAWLLALGLAAALGAAHALSPGHGKALIAAYLVGSRGTLRRAGALGLTVAVSHTMGVFVLGAIVLSASELLVPDRVVAWLSMASGILVILLGATTARRALGRRSRGHDHGHDSGHRHDHATSGSDTVDHGHPPLREVVTLGLAGGLVPSTSALIVLLVAVTTGRVVEGMALIGAFGLGMAVVLAGLAGATSLARNGLADSPRLAGSPSVRRIANAVPLASAAVIMVAGAAATIGAIGSL